MKKLLIYVSVIFIVVLLFITLESFFVVSTYPIFRNMEQKRILRVTDKYDTLNGEHFFIRYKEEDKDIALITQNVLESHYEEICGKLKCFPKEEIPVIIYSEEDEFINTIKLETEKSPLGAYYCGIINILSPFNWVEDKENVEQTYKEIGPHIHEFTHLLIDEKTNGNYPMWLTEGAALYMERELIGIDWEVGKGKTQKIDIKTLNDDFDKIDVGIAYRKSLEVVDNIISKYGFDKFNMLLDNLGKGNNVNSSVKKTLKINLKDID